MADGFPPPSPVPDGLPESGAATRPANGLGIASLVLGIVGTLLSETVVLGLLFGAIALVFGLIGRGRVGRGAATNGRQALAGVILGAAAILLSLACAALIVFALLHEGCTSEGSTCTF